MNKLFALILTFSFLAVPASAQSPTEQRPVIWPTEYEKRVDAVKGLIASNAKAYNLSQTKQNFIFRVITCENKELEPTLQSRIVQADGTREPSYGLAQIHLPSHKTTLAEATDPNYAIHFIVENVAAGREDMWTCARILKHN